jgi:hypothetical protein
MLDERRIVDDWSRVESRWILVEDSRRSESTISVRLYSAGELGALLRGCGFGRVEFFGGLDGCPYDHDARRLVALARR